MHGLLATQTESPQVGGDSIDSRGPPKDVNLVSQEDNERSSPLSSPARGLLGPPETTEPTHSLSNSLCPSKSARKERSCPKDITGRIDTLQPSANGGTVSSSIPLPQHQSHSIHPPGAQAGLMAPPPRPKSPYIASQDSFAGPISQPDPAAAFRARAKNFSIPASRIGEDTQSTSDEDGPLPVSSGAWHRDHDDSFRPTSPVENILVAGTPSESSRPSQSQPLRSQSRFSESQGEDHPFSDPFPPAQPRTHDVDLSDYQTGYTQETDDNIYTSSSPPADAPQFSTSQATEPADETVSTQLPDDTPPTQIVEQSEHSSDERSGLRPSPAAGTKRQLFSMIPPDKWHRYENIEPDLSLPSYFKSHATEAQHVEAASTQPQDAFSDDMDVIGPTQPTQPTTLEQTQPSDMAVRGSTAPSTVQRRGLPPANHVLQARGLRPSAPPSAQCHEVQVVTNPDSGNRPTQIAQNPEEVNEDTPDTQVVPDSEDAREQLRAGVQLDRIQPERTALQAASSVATYHSPEKPRSSRRCLQSEDEVLRTIVSTEPSVPIVEEADEHEEGRAEAGEEDEEEDLPLAKTLARSTKRKGKEKATSSSVQASPVAKKARKGSHAINELARLHEQTTAQKSRSWRDAVIPSSDPTELREDGPSNLPSKSNTGKPRTPLNQPPPPVTRSAPRAAKLAARGRYVESSDEDDGEENDLEPLSDDGDTIPAQDDDMDVDLPDAKPKPPRGNKRKRTVSSSAKKASSKAGPSKVVKEESSTPAGRPSKRFKAASSTRVGSSSEPTRVFALWKSTAAYYSGTVHSLTHPATFIVNFDDGDHGDVELKHIRACQLKEGDEVFLGRRKGKVVDPPRSDAGYKPDDVVSIDVGDGVIQEVEVQSLQIASKTVSVEWGDRVLSEDTIVPIVRPKLNRVSPTPSRMSAPSESSARGARRVLGKTGLVVTLSPKTAKWAHEKDKLMNAIRSSGGVVLDDWSSLFAMEGTLELKGQRWILAKEDIKWTNRSDIERAFLISDDSHQKPRFLIALALGIPCVSIEWVRAMINKVCAQRSHTSTRTHRVLSRKRSTGSRTCFPQAILTA